MSLRKILTRVFAFFTFSLLPFSMFAAPVMSLGDNAVLAARISGAVQLNDNIFLDPILEKSDTVFIMSPGIEFRLGSDISNSNLKIVYVHDFVSYDKNSQLNRNNPNISLDGSFGTAKSGISYSAGYKVETENSASNNAFRQLVVRDNINGKLDGEWGMTAKTSMRAGIHYSDIDYSSGGLVDREVISLPFDLYWQYSPKLDLSVGYRYRTVEYSGTRPDNNDHFLNVGLRGQIASKTTAQVRMGVQRRDFNIPGTSDADLFSIDGILTWEATPKTVATVIATRDFGADSFGRSIETTRVTVSGKWNINDRFSSFASARFEKDKYETGRKDDSLYAQVGFNYSVTENLILTIAQVYYTNDSTLAIANFDSNITNLSGTLRF